jgi:hypothetical protein
MREVFLSYWNSFFADLVRPYRDDITAISTLVIAIFAVVLARVAWKQTQDARILHRAYLDVKFGGVGDVSTGELVGRVDLKNIGHLPVQKLRWLVRLDSGGSNWRPPKIRNRDLAGESVIPPGAEWPRGSEVMIFRTLVTREVCTFMCGDVRLMRTGLDGARGELISATAIRGK